ncbi:MAG: VTT domain-containing protein [Haloarculaceae archaeon]
MQPTTRRQVAGLSLLAACVLAGALLLSPDRVLAELRALAARPLVFGVALFLAYALRMFLAWPISLFSVLLGFLYGPVAIPVGLAGAVVTCLPPYLLARRAGTAGPLGRAGEAGERLFEVTGGLRGVAAARLAPLPTDPVSYGAGLSGVRLGPYVAGTALGEAPWVAVTVTLGASLETLSVEGVSTGLPLLAAALALALLLVAGPLYRHLRDGDSAGVGGFRNR